MFINFSAFWGGFLVFILFLVIFVGLAIFYLPCSPVGYIRLGSEESFGFTVVCWNVLAKSYAKFLAQNEFAQNWDSRSAVIHAQLRKLDGDIVCLQEVDMVRPISETLSFLGLTTAYERRQRHPDGCLIAWRRSKFELIKRERVNFNDLATLTKRVYNMPSESKYKRDNVAVLCALRHRPTGHTIIVACAHLYWNPGFEDVKLHQAMYLIHCLLSFTRGITGVGGRASVVLSGDLNSKPDSELYKLLTQGKLQRCPVVDNPNKIKLLFDAQLSKVCRWVRGIGIDCELMPYKWSKTTSTLAYADSSSQSPSLEAKRSGTRDEKEAFKDTNFTRTGEISSLLANLTLSAGDEIIAMFQAARTTRRILVTKNKSAARRKDCPPHLLLKSNDSQFCFNEVCRYFQLDISDHKHHWSRCVGCNGMLVQLSIQTIRETLPPLPATPQKLPGQDYTKTAASRPLPPVKESDRVLATKYISSNKSPGLKGFACVKNIPCSSAANDTPLVLGIPEALARAAVDGKVEMEFFRCARCEHSYWWGRRSDREYARLKAKLESAKRHCNRINNTTVSFKAPLERKPEKKQSRRSRKARRKAKSPQVSYDPGATETQTLLSRALRRLLGTYPTRQMHISSPVRFRSAYKSVDGREPTYTNHAPPFQGTLDYIFFADQHIDWSLVDAKGLARASKGIGSNMELACVKVRPVDSDVVYQGGLVGGEVKSASSCSKGLPDQQNPSDHLPLKAYFQFRQKLRETA
ncbi:hypothetical protein AAMO2058_000185900 [Amorphochlora amoebiformis]